MDNPKGGIGNQGLIDLFYRTVGWLKSFLVLLLILQILLTYFNIAGSFDFPWQFAEGEFILKHGHSSHSVMNAYGEISPHFENEYIFYEALIAGVDHLFGWMGLCLFFTLLCFLIYVPCLLAFLRAHDRFVSIDLCLFFLAEYLVNTRLAGRPELVADVCYILAGTMLMKWRVLEWNGPRTLALGLVFFCWGNAHGTFLIGLVMVGLWYGQAFVFQWRELLGSGGLAWMRPGWAAFLGCAMNPFGLYRFIQPFQLHGLVWGQGTSLEMKPIAGGIAILPMALALVTIMVLLIRMPQRNYTWLILTLVLLDFMAFQSIRYIGFIGLSMLLVTWDGLRHPREAFVPSVFPLIFAVMRVTAYLYVLCVVAWVFWGLAGEKVAMLQGYNREIRPVSLIVTTSSFRWLRAHPEQEYVILSFLDAGSWAQMPGTEGIHPMLDSGTHRYSDRTNQLYYYTLYSPETLRRVISRLHVNAVLVGTKNIYWAPVLNADPEWRLVHVRSDSQLYLRRNGQGTREDRQLFEKWEAIVDEDVGAARQSPDPADVSFVKIVRGLGLRPDADSLRLLAKAPDPFWMEDPCLVYVRDWLDRVPDKVVADALQSMNGRKDDDSMALQMLLLFRLHQDQGAVELAQEWHPAYLKIGYPEMRMFQAEAFLRTGNKKQAGEILASLWPKPRYSLYWSRLCAEAYADVPASMPRNARLLMSLADNPGWKEQVIAVMNDNIARFSKPLLPMPEKSGQ